MSMDKTKIFDDTPGKAGAIHLNNAGSSLMPASVLAAQVDHLQLEAQIGGYEAADKAANEIDAVYGSVARLLNCSASEIAITENATVGWSMVFYAIPFKPGDRILTAEAEYASNYLAYLHVAKEKGVSVEVIPCDDDGVLCLQSLEAMIDDRVKLISITHVPTNSGLVNPVIGIGQIARKHDILYLVDACQSAGQMPLDVAEIQCDMLSATGRKYMRGPRGVGFLYVRQTIIKQLHPPMIDLLSAKWLSATDYVLRDDARRFENWESNYAAKLGLGAAVDYALDIGLDAIEVEIKELSDYFRDQLRSIDGIFLHARNPHQCGIITFAIEGATCTAIKERLKAKNIHVSITTPSSTLIEALQNDLPDLVRASIHYFNDKDELDTVLTEIRAIAAARSSVGEI